MGGMAPWGSWAEVVTLDATGTEHLRSKRTQYSTETRAYK